ncbi:MAG: Rieske 2Fe-2S domain-containing protein [Thermomicrobiales bacterium]
MRNTFRFAASVATGLGLTRIWSSIARFHTAAGTKVSRRNFTRNAVLGGVALNLGLLGAGFVRFFWPNKTGAFGRALTVPASDIPPVDGEPYQFAVGKFYVVHNSDGLLALYWKCPHLGCTVPWAPNFQEFRCPCHGSIYDLNGINTGGPAPRPLDTMTIAVQSNGDIVVDTGDITQRGHEYTPDQATPYPF